MDEWNGSLAISTDCCNAYWAKRSLRRTGRILSHPSARCFAGTPRTSGLSSQVFGSVQATVYLASTGSYHILTCFILLCAHVTLAFGIWHLAFGNLALCLFAVLVVVVTLPFVWTLSVQLSNDGTKLTSSCFAILLCLLLRLFGGHAFLAFCKTQQQQSKNSVSVMAATRTRGVKCQSLCCSQNE